MKTSFLANTSLLFILVMQVFLQRFHCISSHPVSATRNGDLLPMSRTDNITTSQTTTQKPTTTNTATSLNNGKREEPYGFTDQNCIDTSTCMEPRECVWVGTKTCAESLNICTCKIPNNRQLCASSDDCMIGDRCYQVGALLQQRCVSCSLKGTAYKGGILVVPVDNGITCDLKSLNESSPEPSPDTNDVINNPFNVTNNNPFSSKGSPSPFHSPGDTSNSTKTSSDSSILPGLIGGIAVAIIVPVVIIILICLKISYNRS